MNITAADLLTTYNGPCSLIFANGDQMDLPAGRWWTAAYGIVVDCNKGGCLATPQAAWKIGSKPEVAS